MEDHDTSRSNGFAKPIHSNPLAASRSLHVVIDGPGQGGNNNNKTAKGKHGPTKSDSSNLLSCLYAIIVILLSLLFPLTEALNDKWLQTEYYAAFIVYQQVVACAFLLYLQLYLLRVEHSHGKKHRKPKVFDASQIKTSSTGIHITDAAKDNSSPPAKKPRPESRYRKILKHFTGSKAALAHAGTVNEGFSDPESPGKAQNGPTVSAKLRCTRSLSNLNDRGADILSDRRNAMTDFSELNTGGMSLYRPDSTCSLDLDQEEFGDYVDEDSEVWIDAGRLGNLFSHDGSSFYLRMGCVLFAIGNVVYICLELQTNSQIIPGCPETPFWWVYVFRLAYLLLQTFFIFKHPHIHITKHEPLVRFGLMHLIATNMGIWIRTLVSEINLEYDHLQHLPKDNSSAGAHAAVAKMALAAENLKPAPAAGDAESPNCRGVLQGSAGYLFPFVLEYSLIALGTFIIMYLSINENSNNSVVQGLSNLMKIHALEEQPAPDAAPDSVSVSSRSFDAKTEEENILKKSHRGLFAGILLLSGSLISTVMFFFQLEKYPLTSQIIYLSTDITINVVMMIGAVIAIIKLNVLNYVEKPASVDDVLLLLSMAGGVLFEFTRVFASTNSLIAQEGHNEDDSSTLFLTVFSGITASAQIIVQVVLVVSGMRRYPSKLQHIKKMPGRGCIIFLLIGNISVWIYRTLQAKEFVLHEEEMNYYGQLAWLLLVNISLPLLLFFRFHSSICLADVWHSAYTPLHQKIAKAQPTAGDGGHHREASVHGGPGEGGEMDADRVSISGLLRSVSMGNLSAALQTESRFNKHSSRNAAFLKRGDTMLTELGDIEMVHADDHRLRM